MNLCAPTRKSDTYPENCSPPGLRWVQKTCVNTGCWNTWDQMDFSFTHTDTHDGIGCVWNCGVCVLGSDSVLSRHIRMWTPGLLSPLHLNRSSSMSPWPWFSRRVSPRCPWLSILKSRYKKSSLWINLRKFWINQSQLFVSQKGTINPFDVITQNP